MRKELIMMIMGFALMAIAAVMIAAAYADECVKDTVDYKTGPTARVDSSAVDSEYQGRLKKYGLLEISDLVDDIELRIKLPVSQKFNHAAPFVIEAFSDEPEVIEIGKYDITKGARKLKLPVKLKPGEATLFIDLNFSYCGIVNSSLCYFEDLRLEIPVKITAAGCDKFTVVYEVLE